MPRWREPSDAAIRKVAEQIAREELERKTHEVLRPLVEYCLKEISVAELNAQHSVGGVSGIHDWYIGRRDTLTDVLRLVGVRVP